MFCVKSLLVVHPYFQVLTPNSSLAEAEEFEDSLTSCSPQTNPWVPNPNVKYYLSMAIASCRYESGNWDPNLMRHFPLSHFIIQLLIYIR